MLVFMLMRILRNRRLSPRERRRRAIRMATIYLCIFLGLGLIFLILGLANYISSYQYPMMICFVYAGVELLLIVFCVLRSREFRQPGGAALVDDLPPPNPNYAGHPEYGYQHPAYNQQANQNPYIGNGQNGPANPYNRIGYNNNQVIIRQI